MEGMIVLRWVKIRLLIRRLKAADSVERRTAVESLQKLGWIPKNDAERALEVIATWERPFWGRLDLERIGDAAVAPLISVLKEDTNPEFRDQAASALGAIGDQRAVAPLLHALNDEDLGVRRRAAIVLGEDFGDDLVVEQLISLLNTEEGWQAERALAAIGVAAIDPLIRTLGNDDGQLHKGASNALSNIRDAEAVEPLIAALKNTNWVVRRAAAIALGKLKDVRAVEPLTVARMDGIQEVRQQAEWSLGALGIMAIEPLIQALHGQDGKMNLAIANALTKIVDPRAVEPLIWMLNQDPHYVLRLDVIMALGKIGDPRAVEPLIESFTDDVDMNRTIAAALGGIGPAVIEPLTYALKHGNQILRESAVLSLSCIGRPAIRSLVAALTDQSWSVRHAAAGALNQIGWTPENEIENVLHVTANNVFNSSIPLGATVVDTLIAVLCNLKDSIIIRCKAAKLLGEIEDVRAIKSLAGALKGDSPDVREAVAQALKGFDGIQVVGPLIEALGDRHWPVRRAARDTLRAVNWTPVAPEEVARWALVNGDIEEAFSLASKHGFFDLLLETFEDQVHYIEAQGRWADVWPEAKKAADEAENALVAMGATAVESLLNSARNKPAIKNHRVLSALGKIHDPEAIDTLVEAFESDESSQEIKRAVANALAAFRDRRLSNKLVKAVRKNPSLRDDLLKILAKHRAIVDDVEPLITTGTFEVWLPHELLSIRSPNLRPLLELSSDKQNARLLVKVLERWLLPCDPSVSEDELRTILSWESLTQIEAHTETDGDGTVYIQHYSHERVSTVKLKALASDELVRRGKPV